MKIAVRDTVIELPARRDLFYGGAWHPARGGNVEIINPATGETLGLAAEANAEDVDAAVQAAHSAFLEWRRLSPAVRLGYMRRVTAVMREHGEELAMLDTLNTGNPIQDSRRDAMLSAAQIDFFAGLMTEIKGETIPMGNGALNMTVREPYGVCARIVAYNHPLFFIACKIGSAIAAGNTVIVKPPPQAPLSALRLMELIADILPPGVVNMLTGGRECGQALTEHPLVPVVTLIGSGEAGASIARTAADQFKHVALELGGKNACIIYPDADLQRAIEGAVRGANFNLCGQSCGSTTRIFVHESVYDEVVAGLVKEAAVYRPGDPTDPETRCGSVISRTQLDKILHYIELGKAEGARLMAGGKRPDDPALAKGLFVEPTIFADVTMDMRIAREEIFGPVMSIIKWSDENEMFDQVNCLDLGLTAAIFTRDLSVAHRAAAAVDVGYVWINNSSAHFYGAPFGGYKRSGVGREECLEELLSLTQIKNIHIVL